MTPLTFVYNLSISLNNIVLGLIGIKSVLPSHSTFKSCARILSVFTHARSQMIHFPPLNPPMYQLRVRNVGNNSTSLLTYVST